RRLTQCNDLPRVQAMGMLPNDILRPVPLDSLFFGMPRRPARSALFPYTTLFRSIWQPIPIAGVDPVAEAQLVGLDQCVKSGRYRSEEHTSELQSLRHLVCRLLLEKKNCLAPHRPGDRTSRSAHS